MTDDQKRIQVLEDIIYNIDFACRCCVHPEDAVRTIHNLTMLAKIPYVIGPQQGVGHGVQVGES